MVCWLLYSRRYADVDQELFSLYDEDVVSKLFGDYIRSKREFLRRESSDFSIRKVAQRIGIHHSYLSKIERGEPAALSEKRMFALAAELEEDYELLLAMCGKISEVSRRAVFDNPQRVVKLLKQIKGES